MVDPVTRARLSHRALYVAIALGVLFFRLLPLDPSRAGFNGPDITLALTLSWLLRRPDYVPALLIVAVMLLEDLLFQRPPGLWPLVVLGVTEFLRGREETFRGQSFLIEWLIAGGAILAMVVIARIALVVTVVPQPGLGRELLSAFVTIAAYPLVAGISVAALGLRRLAPGAVDELGHPI